MREIDWAGPYVRAIAHGRTELAGNHTDHQGGRAIAATLGCGVEAFARPLAGSVARVRSEGFAPFEIELADTAPRECEQGTAAALVRGVVACLRAEGVPVGGFEAQVRSDVPAGGGLSSSAAFELALARALECLAAGPGVTAREAGCASAPERLGPLQLARIGQAAERDWFGKPCGLMDQLAIALGGIAVMDFSGASAVGERIDFDFEAAGLALFLVDTHCDHSSCTDEYAQVACDMGKAARFFGATGLSCVPEGAFHARLPELRRGLGDLPALRALHYYNEMALVDERARALRAGDVRAFLEATRRSGASSACYLQNVSVAGASEQPAMVALAVAERAAGPRGAARIHGGGFGGTVQAFVPADEAGAFAARVDALLGGGSCTRYRLSPEGARAAWCAR